MDHDVYDGEAYDGETYGGGASGGARASGVYNGMAATELHGVAWQKSRHSNSQGSCVEFARLPGGDVAVRNSRFPDGPALVYTRAEIEAMLLGVKDGEFDHLIAG
ncbi:hypothetical protein SUDANB58_03193 [Streptomyces sp. enrichment culture]|uniref:DUF397 domain-containing protein n=1 Tax=Streptomyces sp. enrichment culture TaxID=1795815 RepID=UPI003F547925